MTQEQKDLLLKDLCARLPYGVKFACNKNIYTAKGLDLIVTDGGDWEYAVTAKGIAPIEIDFIKPYLFPLSSMTEEQMHDFFCRFVVNEIDYIDFKYYYVEQNRWNKIFTTISDCFEVVTWFNKNHFDAYCLIPMGLANDATGKNIY